MADKARQILLLHHTGSDQIGTADDALQRRFQLMRYIGGKLAAVLLRKSLLRYIKQQQHRTNDMSIGLDAGNVDPVLAAIVCIINFAVAIFHRRLVAESPHGCDQSPKAFAGSVFCAKHLLGRCVDTQNSVILVQQYKPFTHVFRDLGKFICFLLQPA